MVISHYIVIQVANGYKNIIKHDAALVYMTHNTWIVNIVLSIVFVRAWVLLLLFD